MPNICQAYLWNVKLKINDYRIQGGQNTNEDYAICKLDLNVIDDNVYQFSFKVRTNHAVQGKCGIQHQTHVLVCTYIFNRLFLLHKFLKRNINSKMNSFSASIFVVKKLNSFYNNSISFTECPLGFHGANCSRTCTFPYYGKKCLDGECACSKELCDFATGCKETTTKSN